ncbi:MAG: SH3 domain-containing protein [Oscillatoriaceae bacterium SKW80]|nr:SH3 domain-containing protein [Oscillatoriaceae bacterium SKYG93]MCX8120063.1 SH3 domain-containing protein [Oscillatoriaceae bacterium SKW80]MDW8454067.1 SH3 domain-containing protein [Oscillatoriaceae cyanobacterium SKYGB_i_bin93]HIK29695.1 SH3 domain-containing protein [Oscillatoriaceae cyanobacterium M7585_C2015_266]
MKNSQLIVICLVGIATAIGAGLATIQYRSPESNAVRTQLLQTQANTVPTPSEPANTAKPAPIIVTPPSEGCKITQAIVSDPNPPLNVRSSPKVTSSNIVGQLENGTFVSVSEERNGWFRINNPIEGWIFKKLTESTCSDVKTRINFPAGGEEALVKGRIIGGGSHAYLLRAAQGQTMTIIVHQGALPFVFPANDFYGRQEMTGGGHYTGKNRWSGRIPYTGDYQIQLDSNFKGFVYEFTVKVK